MQPFPRAFGRLAEENGGNAMGLKGSDHDRLVLEIESIYTNKADDDTISAWSKEITDRLTIYMKDVTVSLVDWR